MLGRHLNGKLKELSNRGERRKSGGIGRGLGADARLWGRQCSKTGWGRHVVEGLITGGGGNFVYVSSCEAKL